MNTKQFQNLLTRAIGPNTQVAFAEKADITPEHLSRLLKPDLSSRPSKTTLAKIAKASDVDIKELFESCDYSPKDAKGYVLKGIGSMTIPQRCERLSLDIYSAFEHLINKHKIWSSFGEIHDAYTNAFIGESSTIMIYSTDSFGKEYPPMSLASLGYGDLTRSREKINMLSNKNGDYFVPCYAAWREWKADGTIYLIRNFFVLFYAKTESGKIILTDIAIDGETLNRCNVIAPAIAESLFEDGEDVNQKSCYYEIIKRKMSQEEMNEHIAEKRLLDAIFGNHSSKEDSEDTRILPNIFYGIGIEWLKTPDKFAEFLAKYKDYFISREEDSEMYEEVLSSDKTPESINKIFENIYENQNIKPLDVVEAVLVKKIDEIGLEGRDVVFNIDNTDDPKHQLNPVLIVSEDAYLSYGRRDTVTEEKIKTIIKEIAKDLGMQKYGYLIGYELQEWCIGDSFPIENA